MIICHEHQFIFIKTTKTAGTSTELYLRQFCGPDDVVTPCGDPDEELALELGVGGPRNYRERMLWPWEIRARSARRLLRDKKWPQKLRHRNHQPASEIRSVIGDSTWNRYRKITVVRNPWDATVSRYYWRQVHRSVMRPPSVDEAVALAGSNWRIYSINDQSAVDSVLRFEQLEADLVQFAKELGVVSHVPLPRAKAGIRPQSVKAHDLLSQAQAREVARLAHREIELFGYTWTGAEPL